MVRGCMAVVLVELVQLQEIRSEAAAFEGEMEEGCLTWLSAALILQRKSEGNGGLARSAMCALLVRSICVCRQRYTYLHQQLLQAGSDITAAQDGAQAERSGAASMRRHASPQLRFKMDQNCELRMKETREMYALTRDEGGM